MRKFKANNGTITLNEEDNSVIIENLIVENDCIRRIESSWVGRNNAKKLFKDYLKDIEVLYEEIFSN